MISRSPADRLEARTRVRFIRHHHPQGRRSRTLSPGPCPTCCPHPCQSADPDFCLEGELQIAHGQEPRLDILTRLFMALSCGCICHTVSVVLLPTHIHNKLLHQLGALWVGCTARVSNKGPPDAGCTSHDNATLDGPWLRTSGGASQGSACVDHTQALQFRCTCDFFVDHLSGP